MTIIRVLFRIGVNTKKEGEPNQRHIFCYSPLRTGKMYFKEYNGRYPQCHADFDNGITGGKICTSTNPKVTLQRLLVDIPHLIKDKFSIAIKVLMYSEMNNGRTEFFDLL